MKKFLLTIFLLGFFCNAQAQNATIAGGSSVPSGAAGGSLAGTYPNPSLGAAVGTSVTLANGVGNGLILKNVGGTADASTIETAGGAFLQVMGTANIWAAATNSLGLVLDYNSANALAVTISAPAFFTGRVQISGLIVPTSPATLTCGSGCSSVSGNPQKMVVTTGTAQTSVTVNFGITWTAAPVCTISSNSTASVVDITSTSTTAITFGASVALTGALLNVLCF